MVIINVLSSANITTGGATCTSHLVTTVLLDEGLLTPVTVPYHSLCQSGLNVGSHACLPLFLHFITTQWDMIGLLTESVKQVKVFMVTGARGLCFALKSWKDSLLLFTYLITLGNNITFPFITKFKTNRSLSYLPVNRIPNWNAASPINSWYK